MRLDRGPTCHVGGVGEVLLELRHQVSQALDALDPAATGVLAVGESQTKLAIPIHGLGGEVGRSDIRVGAVSQDHLGVDVELALVLRVRIGPFRQHDGHARVGESLPGAPDAWLPRIRLAHRAPGHDEFDVARSQALSSGGHGGDDRVIAELLVVEKQRLLGTVDEVEHAAADVALDGLRVDGLLIPVGQVLVAEGGGGVFAGRVADPILVGPVAPRQWQRRAQQSVGVGPRRRTTWHPGTADEVRGEDPGDLADQDGVVDRHAEVPRGVLDGARPVAACRGRVDHPGRVICRHARLAPAGMGVCAQKIARHDECL